MLKSLTIKLLITWGLLIFFSSLSANSNAIVEINYPEHLNIINRADWGWKPINSAYKTHDIKFITVHHGGVVVTPDKDPTKLVQNLQSFWFLA